jgi:hypothetical protein
MLARAILPATTLLPTMTMATARSRHAFDSSRIAVSLWSDHAPKAARQF